MVVDSGTVGGRRTAVTIGDLVGEQRRSVGRRVAYVDGHTERTYRDLDERTDRLAHALAHAGVGGGDRVVWLARNAGRFLEVLVAVAKLGAMVVPLNWRLSAAELKDIVAELEPAVGFCEDGLADGEADAVMAAWPSTRWIDHEADGYEQLLSSGADGPVTGTVDPWAPVLVLYTHSSGGGLNGSMLSQVNLLTQGVNHLLVRGIAADTVYLACSPVFHIWTAKDLVPVLMAGGRIVFVPQADPEAVCAAVTAHRVTLANLLEPTMQRMVEVSRAGAVDLSTLRAAGGSPEWRALVAEDDSLWGRFGPGYGQTEVTGVICYAGLAGYPVAGIAGRPDPFSKVRIASEDGDELPDGEIGEIAVAGPLVHLGYWRRPEVNAERWRNGFWRTNDLGYRDDDGIVHFLGARTRLIKSGAENIHPIEIEARLESHPSVAEAAVIGVPDDTWGQQVVAVVVRVDGASCEEVSEELLIEHCRQGLASFKKPRRVHFVEALPRGAAGKDYAKLDELFGGGGYPGGSTRRPAGA